MDAVRDTVEQLWICGGVTRVDALAAYEIPAVSINGCWGWRTKGKALADFDEIKIKGRRFVLAFDGDVRSNQKVRAAYQALTRYLYGKGADLVTCLALPDNQGLDDWLGNHEYDNARKLTEAVRQYADQSIPKPPPKGEDGESEVVGKDADAFLYAAGKLGFTWRLNLRGRFLQADEGCDHPSRRRDPDGFFTWSGSECQQLKYDLSSRFVQEKRKFTTRLCTCRRRGAPPPFGAPLLYNPALTPSTPCWSACMDCRRGTAWIAAWTSGAKLTASPTTVTLTCTPAPAGSSVDMSPAR